MKWVSAALLLVVGSWMAFDGARAIVVGDYITPGRGEHAGELGPWSRVVARIGIAPRSTKMKVIFVVIGLLHVSASVFLTLEAGRFSGWLALAAAVSGLWYLPFGTALDGLALAVIVLGPLRPW